MDKQCSICKQVLNINEFNNNSSLKDGKQSHCRECNKAKQRQWKLDNPEAYTANHKRWYNNNKGKNNEFVKKWRKKRGKEWYLNHYYNITEEQYDTMLNEQDNKCDICKCELNKPCVDHCHTTGKVRGLLCQTCNTALGKFKDDVDILQRAINYLNK